MPDRFEDLRTFVAVVDAGGFAAAGQRMGVVKSAVSRRVRELEERLGARLFDRTTRSVELTKAGRVFHARAVELLAGLASAEEEVSREDATLRGSVEVTAPASFAAHCIAPVVGRFLDAHPGVSLSVVCDDGLSLPGENGVDVAIRSSWTPDPTREARPLVSVDDVCVASPALLGRFGVPTMPADLARYPAVLRSEQGGRSAWIFADGEVPRMSSRLTLASDDAVLEAAVAGLGVAVLPAYVVHRAVRQGDLRVVLGGRLAGPIWMLAVQPSGRGRTARADAFVDFLSKTYADTPFWEAGLAA